MKSSAHPTKDRTKPAGVLPAEGHTPIAPVIADRAEFDYPGAAGTSNLFAQPFISGFGFFVAVRADEAIENLAHRQGQVSAILGQYGEDLFD